MPNANSASVKSCGCGCTYNAAQWASLALVTAAWDVGEDGVDVLELRNCPCGSTLAIPAVSQ